MKNKQISALLLASVLLSGMTGCGKKETSVPENSVVSEKTQSTSPDVGGGDSLDVSDESNVSQSEFNFDEAVKNITLFGHKISLPCTIADFGDEFSLKRENLSTFGEHTGCDILYKGKSIGTVSLIGYKSGDELNDKEIFSLSLGFIAKDNYASDSIRKALYEKYGWYSGLIEVNIGGLSFESTETEVESLFGEPYKTGDDSADYKFYSDDQSKSVEVSFYQGKVKQITIYA